MRLFPTNKTKIVSGGNILTEKFCSSRLTQDHHSLQTMKMPGIASCINGHQSLNASIDQPPHASCPLTNLM